jgi:hypothetical protein
MEPIRGKMGIDGKAAWMPGQQQRTTPKKIGETGTAATNSTENGRDAERQTPSETRPPAVATAEKDNLCCYTPDCQ